MWEKMGNIVIIIQSVLLVFLVNIGALVVTGHPVSQYLNPERTNSHLVVNQFTGEVYLGATNGIYQLNPKLEVTGVSRVGPFEDSTECYGYLMRICPPNRSSSSSSSNNNQKLTDNVNKVLVIDYRSGKLIHCGSVFQGICWMVGLENISTSQIEVIDRPIVANDEMSSSFAFIAPGPPNPMKTNVFNVATSFTGNSHYRHNVPAVASRSLDPLNILDYASGPDVDLSGITKKTQIFIQNREAFPVNYIYGFSSGGFSYFISTQKRSTSRGSTFGSKLIRFCQKDKTFDSYAEIPIECKSSANSRPFPLVTSAYLGKTGALLGADMEDSDFDDVLYATFSMAAPFGTLTPGGDSALCIFPMRDIRRKFLENIQNCFNGNGRRGLDYMNNRKIQTCVQDESVEINDNFCTSELNSPLGGDIPVVSRSAAIFSGVTLTALAVAPVGTFTVAFVGTSMGELKKLVLEGLEKSNEYDSVLLERGQAIKSDLAFDPPQTHLYVLTADKIMKIRTHSRCSRFTSCGDCVEDQDPYCGWCAVKNMCTTATACAISISPLADAAEDAWIPYHSADKCEAEPIQCPDLAENCMDCLAVDPTMGCGWCSSKNSCLRRNHCHGDDSWMNHGANCTNPHIVSFSPTSGPMEGGTNLTIRLNNYNRPGNQESLYLAVNAAGIICKINSRRPFPQPGLLQCEIRKIPSIISEVKSGPIVVRGPEFRIESRQNFTFSDWTVIQIAPTVGPLRGGTKLTIFGENLDIGSKALAFVGETPCDVTSRTNETISCTTRSAYERGTFIIAVNLDGNRKELSPVFSYVQNPVILQTKHKVLHGTIRGGNYILAEGHHFDGVQDAFFVVMINETEYRGPCNVTTPETLHCVTPKIDEPPESLFPEAFASTLAPDTSSSSSDDENVLVIPYKFVLDTVDTYISNMSEDKHQYFLRLTGENHHHHHHEHETGSSPVLPILLTLLVLLILGILAFLLLRRYRRKRSIVNKHSILTATELQDFQKGKPRHVEKGLLANENPYIVPYNNRFEIPEKRFTVDKESVLGMGAFGMVVKGSVDANPVAVKTLKSDGEKMHLTALMSELKILVHLGNQGKHPNIVNLIGACTKQLHKGSLFVFVEFCPMGSLDKFLRTHRKNFINQVDDDLIDLSTSSEMYENMSPSNMLCTLDLVNYSHQVSKGMEYLEQKKIIHADLATRNLLLYDKTTIKITDFGLARKLYDYTNYVKKHQEPLPWRWMAIESLRDLSFSHQSDVWAYGVTLWEIFTLGDLPYPGLSWTIDFTDRLQHGLQNVKPKYATSDIYNTMLECWKLKPEERPSFSDIRKFFNAVLNDLSSQVEKLDDKDAEGYLVPLLPQGNEGVRRTITNQL